MEPIEGELIRQDDRQNDARLAHLDMLAFLLDRAFKVPGTRWRFGIDALIGLIPGVGDIIGSLIGGYSLWIARQIGAPSSIQARMVLNLAVDGVVGLIPFAGDLFDFAFKAHTRNHALLSRWVAEPHRTQRSSWLVVVLGFALLLAIFAAAGWVFVRTVRWLTGLF